MLTADLMLPAERTLAADPTLSTAALADPTTANRPLRT